jgi:hypothetical protein
MTTSQLNAQDILSLLTGPSGLKRRRWGERNPGVWTL